MKNSIPIDLIYEILSRLPAKSVARCRCVSKLWYSILHRQDFTDLFIPRSSARRDFSDWLLTRFSARPRLVTAVHHEEKDWSFYSTPLPQNAHEKRPLVVAADFHTKFSKGISRSQYGCSYASGLIYFPLMRIPRKGQKAKRVICNPVTGQYVILPKLTGYSYSYLGFDPVHYEFKLLFIKTRGFLEYSVSDFRILTLGTRKLRWRKIKCPFAHEPLRSRICINGVLYYFAVPNVLVCFDFGSEKFKFIAAECLCGHLVNYKGKFCGINLEYGRDGGFLLTLRLWVLEDVEKEEWSKYVYTFSAESEVYDVFHNLSVSGMTSTGDIVLSMLYKASEPFYVFYLNPEKNTLQTVEIQGVGANRNFRVHAFVDYVEDLSVNDAMQLKSSP